MEPINDGSGNPAWCRVEVENESSRQTRWDVEDYTSAVCSLRHQEAITPWKSYGLDLISFLEYPDYRSNAF
jgi:hypothetical protein